MDINIQVVMNYFMPIVYFLNKKNIFQEK